MTGREHLHLLIDLFLANNTDTRTFCTQFEASYNFHTDKAALPEIETLAFKELFEKVIWYSPLPDERRVVPSYLGEKEIEAAVRQAAVRLGKISN